MAHKFVSSNEIEQQVCEALDLDPQCTRRIIIDLQADAPPTIYVEMYGDDRLLEVEWSDLAGGANIKTVKNDSNDSPVNDIGLASPETKERMEELLATDFTLTREQAYARAVLEQIIKQGEQSSYIIEDEDLDRLAYRITECIRQRRQR